MKSTGGKYRIITCEQDPDLVSRTSMRIEAEWPEFMLHDPVADYLDACYEKLPEYQFVLVADPDNTGETVALGNAIPLLWQDDLENLPDDGWDWALTKGINEVGEKDKPNILCALQAVVFGEYRGQGISRAVVAAMKQIAQKHDLDGLIAPVRPNLKGAYPLIDIEKYIRWTDKSGRPFDPWLRVHHNLGAGIIKACRSAMRISGSVAEWESWAKMKFPASGTYIVPGALVPVEIDRESNIGTYVEPNVWMHHPPG